MLVFPVDDLDSCISVVLLAHQLDYTSNVSVPRPVVSTSVPFRECILVIPGLDFD